MSIAASLATIYGNDAHLRPQHRILSHRCDFSAVIYGEFALGKMIWGPLYNFSLHSYYQMICYPQIIVQWELVYWQHTDVRQLVNGPLKLYFENLKSVFVSWAWQWFFDTSWLKIFLFRIVFVKGEKWGLNFYDLVARSLCLGFWLFIIASLHS